MKNAAELKKAMDTLVATAENENRPMTDAELAEFDELKAQFDEAVAAEAEGAAARAEQTAARRAALDAAANRLAETRVTAAPARGATPRPGGPEAAREFESLGEFCAAAVLRPNDPRLAAHYFENDGVRGEQATSSGATGGFLIPPQFLNQLMEVQAAQTIVRSRAFVLPGGPAPEAEITIPALDQTGAVPDNSYGGIKTQWIGEGAEKPETSALFREIKLQPHEVAGHVVVTDKMLRNAPVLGAFLARALPAALYSAEDMAFINGDGIAKPQGFIRSAAAYEVARSGSPAGSVVYEDVVEMVSRLKGENGIWIAAKGLYPTIATMQDPAGNYIFVAGSNANANASVAVPGTLLGMPIIWTERAPAAGSKGDLSLVDLSQYLIKNGVGPAIAASEHVHFVRNKTVIKAFMSVDGQPWLTQPFKGMDNRQYSPFVVLGAG